MKHWRSIGIVAGVAAVAAVAVVAVKSLRSDKDYCLPAVPRDAMLVVRLDAGQLLSHAGISPSDLQGAATQLGDIGIDLRRRAYAFVYRGYPGIVVPLDDRDEFLKRTATLHGEVEKQRGLHWTTYGGSFLLAADDRKAIAIGPATTSEQDELRNTLYTCMTQKEGDGKANPLLARLDERDEPLALAANLAVVSERELGIVAPVFPKNVALSDYTLTAGLSTNKNTITLSASLSGEGEEARAFLADINEAFKPIDASLFATAPANSFLHIEAGVDGDKLIELLRQSPETRTRMLATNMVFDLNMILRSLSGDVSLTVPRLMLYDPDVLLQANVADTGFMSNVMEWNEGVTEQTGIAFAPSALSGYQFAAGGDTYYFDVDDQRLHLTNAEAYAHGGFGGMPVPPDAQGSRVYIALDLASISHLLSLIPMDKSLRCLQRLTLRCDDISQWTLTLTAEDDTDILRYLVGQ